MPCLNTHSTSTNVWPGASSQNISGAVWPGSCPKTVSNISRRCLVGLTGNCPVGREHRATQNTEQWMGQRSVYEILTPQVTDLVCELAKVWPTAHAVSLMTPSLLRRPSPGPRTCCSHFQATCRPTWGLSHGAAAWNCCLDPSPCKTCSFWSSTVLSCRLQHPSPTTTKPCSSHMVA